jgi:Histidine kinase/Y_Y_Y domain/Two component regulator propeller
LLKKNFTYFISCCCIFYATILHAQTPAIKHYGVNQGLPSSESYWSIQDSRGYLWVATDAGVVKYDGYKFITYSNSKGLPDNTVFKIHEDRYGRIWFSTFSGKMAYYEYKTDSIYEIPANKQLTETIKAFPIDFTFDNDDTLFISIEKQGYCKLAPPEYNVIKLYAYPFNCFYTKKISEQSNIYAFYHDTSNYIQRHGYAVVYDMDDNLLTAKTTDTLFYGKGAGVSFAKRNKQFLSCGTAIFEWDGKIFYPLLDPKDIRKPIISIFVDTQNRLWVNTRNQGVFVYDVTFATPKLVYHFLENYSITSAFEDHEHGIWLTTLDDGLFYIPNLELQFYTTKDGLTAERILSIDIFQHKVMAIPIDCAINELDLTTSVVSSFKIDDFGGSSIKTMGNQFLLYGSSTFLYNKNERIPIQATEKITNKFLKLRAVLNVNDTTFLGCELGALYAINKSTGMATIIVKGLPTIFSICKVGNVIYLGTKTGLYVFKNDQLTFLGDQFPELKIRINELLYVNQQLIIGTKGEGVYLFKENKLGINFNERTGLASDIVKCLLPDKDGNVWVGTNKGLSLLKKTDNENYKINTVHLSNGLVSGEINQLAISDSLLFIATTKGLGKINMQTAFAVSANIPVYIENILINNVKRFADSSLILNYHEGNIQFMYKGLNLKSEGDIVYKYRLNGLDTNWTLTKNTFAQFTTLPSGNYTFTVYALTAEGQPSITPASIAFYIAPPFWKTGWFIVLLVLISGFIVFFLFRRRVIKIRKREEQKTAFNKKIVESELKALRSQMNPHFIFNAINSIQNFVIKNESVAAQKYLTKFSRLIRAVLENSKQETILLSKEMEALELYLELEALRASFRFDYSIVIDESLEKKSVYLPPMLIQPYIENAILHGLLPLTNKRGELTIHFEEKEQALICTINDNGIGRAKAAEIKRKKEINHQSMGMSITNERIDNWNNISHYTTVTILDKYNNETSLGTTVILEIKL